MSDHRDAGAGPPTPAIHFASHLSLLGDVESDRRGRLDGIVVPAARHPENLRNVLHLAASLPAPVVVMCSHAARADLAVAEAERVPGAHCVIVDLAAQPGTSLPEFSTSGFPRARVGAHGDLSRKRNLGLLLGRLAGWTRLLFLDDDIAGLDPRQVEIAAAGLDRQAAVGMPALSFPDNSVVCHAHRATGAEQEVFVSGSALAVSVPAADSFFPEIYNEDWLFLAPHLDRRAVAMVGSVVQQEYDPFAFPHRAGVQEFGDVLAEGLIGLLHSARLSAAARWDYWAAFLDARADFLTRTYEGCLTAAIEDERADAALVAVAIAEQTRAGIVPDELVGYVEAWQADLETWRRHLDRLPRLDDLDAALRHLKLAAQEVPATRVAPPLPRERPPRDPASSRRACGE